MENMSINEPGARLHLVFQFPVFNPSLSLGEKGAKERLVPDLRLVPQNASCELFVGQVPATKLKQTNHRSVSQVPTTPYELCFRMDEYWKS